MNFAYKIWLEKDDNTVFGMGIYNILTLVTETGSLHKAAQSLKMSYRAAWGKIRDYEERLGIELLEKGRHGRIGAHLTPEGKCLLESFKKIMEEMDKVISAKPFTEILKGVEKIRVSR